MASENASQRSARFTSHYQGARASHKEDWIDLDEPKGGLPPSSGRPGPKVGGQKGKKEEDPQKKAKKRLRRIIITLVAAEVLVLCLIFSCRYVV